MSEPAEPEPRKIRPIRQSLVLDILSKYLYLAAREVAELEEGRVPEAPQGEPMPDGSKRCPGTGDKHIVPGEGDICLMCQQPVR